MNLDSFSERLKFLEDIQETKILNLRNLNKIIGICLSRPNVFTISIIKLTL